MVIPNATTSNGNANVNGNFSGPEEQQSTPLTVNLQTLVQRLLSLPGLGSRIETGRSQVDVLRSLLELDENLNSTRQQSNLNLAEVRPKAVKIVSKAN